MPCRDSLASVVFKTHLSFFGTLTRLVSIGVFAHRALRVLNDSGPLLVLIGGHVSELFYLVL